METSLIASFAPGSHPSSLDISLNFILKLVGAGNLNQLQPKESYLLYHTWRNWAWKRSRRREEAALLGAVEQRWGPALWLQVPFPSSRAPYPTPPGLCCHPCRIVLQLLASCCGMCSGDADSRLCTSQLLTSHCVLEREMEHMSLCPWAVWIFLRRFPGAAPLRCQGSLWIKRSSVGWASEALCCFYKGRWWERPGGQPSSYYTTNSRKHARVFNKCYFDWIQKFGNDKVTRFHSSLSNQSMIAKLLSLKKKTGKGAALWSNPIAISSFMGASL